MPAYVTGIAGTQRAWYADEDEGKKEMIVKVRNNLKFIHSLIITVKYGTLIITIQHMKGFDDL